MDFADILKYATLAYLICLGIWYATATAKFDRASRARPLLFLVLALSFSASAVTLAIALPADLPDARVLITLGMATFSAILFKWALRSINNKNLGLAFSGIVPGEVVQHGPYRFVRHPLYTAYSIFWASCAVLSASPIVAVLAALIFLFYILAARSEERDLMGSGLAPTYGSYRQRTGLMTPRLFR